MKFNGIHIYNLFYIIMYACMYVFCSRNELIRIHHQLERLEDVLYALTISSSCMFVCFILSWSV